MVMRREGIVQHRYAMALLSNPVQRHSEAERGKSNEVPSGAEAKSCDSEQSRGKVVRFGAEPRFAMAKRCKAMALLNKSEQWQCIPVHSSGRAQRGRTEQRHSIVNRRNVAAEQSEAEQGKGNELQIKAMV
jgi:hypothetical protein